MNTPKEAMNEPTKYYGLEHQEQLDDDLENVVARVVADHCSQHAEPYADILSRIQWPIRVHVFQTMSITRSVDRMAERVLDDVLSSLDEDYSTEWVDATEPTPAMKEAAKTFIQAVLKDYKVYQCNPTKEVIEISREEVSGMMEDW